MSAPSPNARRRPDWLPGRGALLAAALAFGVGLVAFLALWWDQRNNTDFYRSEPGLPAAPGQVFEPLPAPLPAGEGGLISRDAEEERIAEEPENPFVGGAQVPTEPAPSMVPPPRETGPVASGPSSLPRPIQPSTTDHDPSSRVVKNIRGGIISLFLVYPS